MQLVPPNSRDPNRSLSSRRSCDSLATNPEVEGQAPLTRTSSNRSDVSNYSGYAQSVTSVNSFTSTASTRRMIIPLYNLHAHNVMTNVVLDAGTDARVAKFLKRGLEVIGLAVLDPMEVWNHGKPGVDPSPADQPVPDSARNSFDDNHLPVPAPQTPESSAISLSSTGDPTPKARDITPAVVITPQSTPTGAKKFFGKLFRRKDSPVPGVIEPSDSPASSPLKTSLSIPVPSSPAKRTSLLLPDQPAASIPSKDPILQPSVLGIYPTLDPACYPPHGRPTTYVWTVTKWLKGSPDGILGGVKGIFHGDKSARDEPMGELERQVEVRFEWTRSERTGKRKSRKVGADGTEIVAGLSVGDKTTSRRNSTVLTNSNNPSVSSLHDKKKAKRASVVGGGLARKRSLESARSGSPKRPGSIATNTTTSETGGADDEARRSKEGDGEESDPEDSEVPWTCTLHVVKKPPGSQPPSTTNTPGGSRFSQRSGLQRNQNLSGTPTPVQQQQQSLGVQPSSTTSQGPPPIKLKVATVSPTPHHPKVVSLLKVPFPLPDVEVSSVTVRKRIVTPVGIARPVDPHSPTAGNGMGNLNMQSFSLNGGGGKSRENGLVLTAEEIKDVVASTALWLVVREGMGGVGRDKRKGDGWKLRG